MKRPFPRIEVLGLTAALAIGGSCSPNNSVKPGAPVLTEMVIVDNGTPYAITSAAPQCPSTVTEGVMCNAQTDTPCQVVGGSDGGAVLPPNWCRCRGASQCPEFAPAPTMSTWNCGPFGPTTPIIAVFDRLLDTAPFDLSDGGPLTNVASLQPPTPMANIDAVYTPNGSPEFDDAGNYKTLLFPIFEHCIIGAVLNDNGPNLVLMPAPQLPTGSTVTVKLNPTTVLAKDGRTPFASSGALLDGMLTFQTSPFDATLTVPLPPADAGAAGAADGGVADGGAAAATVLPDMTAVEIDFTAPVDVTKDYVDIKVVANGTELQLVLSQPDGGAASNVLAASPTPTSITLTPVSNWPANSTITVTVEATATDLIGEPLPTARSASFVTGS